MRFSAISCLCFQLLAGTTSSAREQAPLIGETDATEMKLVAYVKSSDDRTASLETEWTAARSATDLPMEWAVLPAQDHPDPGLAPDAYPVIRLLRDGVAVADYTGPRTSGEILRFARRAKRSSEIPFKVHPEDADSFKSIDDFVCIARLEPSETAIRDAFAGVAEKYWNEFTFGVLDSTGAAVVVCHKRDDDSTHTWTSGPEGLEAWVLEASRPVIAELTPANYERFLARGWPMVYIFSPSSSVRASIRADLHSFAKGQYSSLTCVTVDPIYFPNLPGKLGLGPGDYPAGAVHQLSSGKIYPYPRGRDFSPRELQGWGLDVWQGRVKPWTPPGREPPREETKKSSNVRIVGSHNIKVKDIPGLKIKIGGRERDEL